MECIVYIVHAGNEQDQLKMYNVNTYMDLLWKGNREMRVSVYASFDPMKVICNGQRITRCFDNGTNASWCYQRRWSDHARKRHKFDYQFVNSPSCVQRLRFKDLRISINFCNVSYMYINLASMPTVCIPIIYLSEAKKRRPEWKIIETRSDFDHYCPWVTN